MKPQLTKYKGGSKETQYRATLGNAVGIGENSAVARAKCVADAMDLLTVDNNVRMEVRQGYFIIYQQTSSTQGWYLIKKISEMQDGFLHMSCGCSWATLRPNIESDLKRRIADDATEAQQQ